MTDINKVLTQIVSSLMEIISTNSQTPLQPQPKKISKTQQMSYHDYLKKVLANKPPITTNSKRYSLQQDIQLIVQLSEQNNITFETFQIIAKKKRINRTAQSIRLRYNTCLSKIQQKQIKKIISYIENQGLEGYLIFDDQMHIFPEEKQPPKQIKRQRPTSLDKQGKKGQKRKVSLQNVHKDSVELNKVLMMYQKMVNIPIKTLLIKLDQVSGDMEALDDYLTTKDERLLWSSQQDNILMKGGIELQILRKYRKNTIERRKKYLGLI